MATGAAAAQQQTPLEQMRNDPQLANLIAVELAQAGRLEEAGSLLRAVLAIAPAEMRRQVLTNLAFVDRARGDYHGAWHWVRRVIALDPQRGLGHAASLAGSAMLAGAHDIFWAANEAVRALDPDGIRGWSGAYIASEFRIMPGSARPVGRRQLRGAAPAVPGCRGPSPARLALIGSEFGRGTSFNRMMGPFRRLAGLGFEVHCLWLRDGLPPDGTGWPGARFTPVPEGDATALRNALHAIAPDVIVDLACHAQPQSFAVLAERVAPLQLAWSGNAVSSGTDVFDAILTDRAHCPPGAEHHYAGPVLRLPVPSMTVEPEAADPAPTPLPADRNGHITFGAFHRLSKVTPEVIALWAEVLLAVPGSRLVMKTFLLENPRISGRIAAAFASHGIGADRLRLLGGSDRESHTRIVADVDLALGPFPEQGMVTDFDSFWLGVPTISYGVDDRPCARLAACLSAAAGAPFLATRSPTGFVAAARSLAADPGYLRQARPLYRGNLVAAGLTDHQATAAAIAAAIRRLWADLPQGGGGYQQTGQQGG